MESKRLIGTMTCGCGWRLELWDDAPPGAKYDLLDVHLLKHRLEALRDRQRRVATPESNRPASPAGR